MQPTDSTSPTAETSGLSRIKSEHLDPAHDASDEYDGAGPALEELWPEAGSAFPTIEAAIFEGSAGAADPGLSLIIRIATCVEHLNLLHEETAIWDESKIEGYCTHLVELVKLLLEAKCYGYTALEAYNPIKSLTPLPEIQTKGASAEEADSLKLVVAALHYTASHFDADMHNSSEVTRIFKSLRETWEGPLNFSKFPQANAPAKALAARLLLFSGEISPEQRKKHSPQLIHVILTQLHDLYLASNKFKWHGMLARAATSELIYAIKSANEGVKDKPSGAFLGVRQEDISKELQKWHGINFYNIARGPYTINLTKTWNSAVRQIETICSIERLSGLLAILFLEPDYDNSFETIRESDREITPVDPNFRISMIRFFNLEISKDTPQLHIFDMLTYAEVCLARSLQPNRKFRELIASDPSVCKVLTSVEWLTVHRDVYPEKFNYEGCHPYLRFAVELRELRDLFKESRFTLLQRSLEESIKKLILELIEENKKFRVHFANPLAIITGEVVSHIYDMVDALLDQRTPGEFDVIKTQFLLPIIIDVIFEVLSENPALRNRETLINFFTQLDIYEHDHPTLRSDSRDLLITGMVEQMGKEAIEEQRAKDLEGDSSSASRTRKIDLFFEVAKYLLKRKHLNFTLQLDLCKIIENVALHVVHHDSRELLEETSKALTYVTEANIVEGFEGTLGSLIQIARIDSQLRREKSATRYLGERSERQIGQVREELTKYKANLETASTERDDLQRRYNVIREERDVQLRKRREAEEKRKDAFLAAEVARRELKEIKQETKSLRGRVGELEAEINRLKKEINKMEKLAHETDEAKKRALKEAQIATEEATRAAEVAIKERDVAHLELEESRKVTKALEDKVKLREEEIEKLRGALEKATREAKDKKIAELEEIIAHLRQDIDEMQRTGASPQALIEAVTCQITFEIPENPVIFIDRDAAFSGMTGIIDSTAAQELLAQHPDTTTRIVDVVALGPICAVLRKSQTQAHYLHPPITAEAAVPLKRAFGAMMKSAPLLKANQDRALGRGIKMQLGECTKRMTEGEFRILEAQICRGASLTHEGAACLQAEIKSICTACEAGLKLILGSFAPSPLNQTFPGQRVTISASHRLEQLAKSSATLLGIEKNARIARVLDRLEKAGFNFFRPEYEFEGARAEATITQATHFLLKRMIDTPSEHEKQTLKDTVGEVMPLIMELLTLTAEMMELRVSQLPAPGNAAAAARAN